MAETSGLLNRRTGDSRTEGSNPSVSAKPLPTAAPPVIASVCRGSKADIWLVALLDVKPVEQQLGAGNDHQPVDDRIEALSRNPAHQLHAGKAGKHREW